MNFTLSNCLRFPHTYRVVVRKVFLFETLGEASIFALQGKVPILQYSQEIVCVGVSFEWVCKAERLQTLQIY